ncbi:molybdate ABC transporter substrate-binding protein [Clostridium grantii]|uniref:Molybdate-binding protein ModA n=1 Tax=Clostridium grantii DSM 8605 TaxID=1121316 RepID=A0A1M5XD31_9CLOT|nr:molybdate ABC transporter substrate-binding protein [Clostridium grantii]SHH97757.1 molybdate transport system substrate-binding protein [Clostridium grantii DSM 8605]
MLKKTVSLVLGVLIMCFAFTGCSSANTGNISAGNEISSEKNTEVSVTEELNVFAAASLTESFTEIAEAFEQENNVKVVLNFAGSQALYTSIDQGAEADVFASANTKYMKQLTESKMVGDSNIFVKNGLVIGVMKDSEFKIESLKDLTQEGLILVAAEDSVPVGNYFYKALDNALEAKTLAEDDKEKILNNIKSKEVDVKSVLSKVLLKEADACIVYKTDVTEAAKENVNIVESSDFDSVIAEYPIAVMENSKNKELANKFIEFVMNSEKGKETMEQYGFILP